MTVSKSAQNGPSCPGALFLRPKPLKEILNIPVHQLFRLRFLEESRYVNSVAIYQKG